MFTILVLIAALYLLLSQLAPLRFDIKVLNPKKPLYVVVALALMPLNWWLETFKWSRLTGLGMHSSIKGVLAGVAVGLFTINRIGDGVGKYFFREEVSKERFGKAFVAGSFGQFGATVIFGMTSIALMPLEALNKVGMWAFSSAGKFWLIVMLMFTLGAIVFLKAKKAKYWPTASQWGLGAFLSALRYAVFSFQYVLILSAFGVELPLIQLWACVALIYFVNTLFPSTVLGELGVREAVSLIIIGTLTTAGWEVATAGLLIWVINLLLPGLLGGYLLWGKYSTGENLGLSKLKSIPFDGSAQDQKT